MERRLLSVHLKCVGASREHFSQIADANAALDHTAVDAIFPVTDTSPSAALPADVPFSRMILSGQQTIAKYHEHARNLVNVWLFLMRLPTLGTDIVITANVPVALHPESSSKPQHEQASLIDEALFRSIISSFQIRDLSLFQSG
jgi:hypothetical protein